MNSNRDINTDQNAIQWNNGIVAMLDILGVKDIPEEKAEGFINKLNEFIDGIEFNFPDVQMGSILVPKADEPPETIVIGDTIIICWQPRKEDINLFLLSFSYIMQSIMVVGLNLGLPIRGAMTIGRYAKSLQSKRITVIGPAISDVGMWFERANWIGIIATPRCGLQLEKLELTTKPILLDYFPLYYVEYSVPLKDNRHFPLWVVSWPRAYQIDAEFRGEDSAEFSFLSDISQMSIPYGTEDKYLNTREFFKYYQKNIVIPKVVSIQKGPHSGPSGENAKDAVYHYNKGVLHLQANELDDAITEFKLATENDPIWKVPLYNCGVAYYRKGDYKSSLECFEKAIQLDADYSDALKGRDSAKKMLNNSNT